MKILVFLNLLLITFLFSCSEQNGAQNKESYTLPENYSLPLSPEKRIQIAEKVLEVTSLPNLRESFSKFSIGPKQGDLIGLFQSDKLLYIIADQVLNENRIKEYYFYDQNNHCYFAAVFTGKDPLILNNYWMPADSDSVFVEIYSLDPSLGYVLIPNTKPISNYMLRQNELEAHILPNKFRAFLNKGFIETQVSETGTLIRKMPMSANQSGVDKGLLQPGQIVRYQMDLDPKFIYTVAVNPLGEGFMLRGIDGDKVFIDGVTDFQWFSDNVGETVIFEVYNDEITRDSEYRIGVFPEPRF